MQPHNLERVKAEFALFLSETKWNWNWVATQTFDSFKVPIHSNIVHDSFNELMKKIARTAVMNYGFVFGEQHKSGLPHWHALLHVSESLWGEPRRSDIWDWAFKRYGRNRIEAFNPVIPIHHESIGVISTGISKYMCKYVAKESARDEATWDFKGFMGGREVPTARIMDVLGWKRSDSPGPF